MSSESSDDLKQTCCFRCNQKMKGKCQYLKSSKAHTQEKVKKYISIFQTLVELQLIHGRINF